MEDAEKVTLIPNPAKHCVRSRDCMFHTGSTGSTVLIFTVNSVDPV
jgi:hypothetical protein